MSEQNILSKTLSETNPNLFFNPVFQNYYLRLFYDVEFEKGMRGIEINQQKIFTGFYEKASICYSDEGSLVISYINCKKKIAKELEIVPKENESIAFTTRQVFPMDGLFYHMEDTQLLKDDKIYPVSYQYVGFDIHDIKNDEFLKEWVYQKGFASKMKDNGVMPKVEHAHGKNETIKNR